MSEKKGQEPYRRIGDEEFEEILVEYVKYRKSNGQEGKSLPRLNITPEELEQVLERHTLWLETNGQQGEQAILRCAVLAGRYFKKAPLTQAKLEHADLKKAKLIEADLQGAGLRGAQLWMADLRGAGLRKADFRAADLGEADLQSAYLTEADLRGAYLFKTDLRGARLLEADLRGAGLRQAKLQGAELNGAKLAEADLSHAEFRADSELSSQDTQNLHARQMAGADVSNAGLPDRVWNGFKDGLANVAEASKKADKLFVGLLAGSIFIFMVLATAKQGGIIELPILKTKIPQSFFYWAAPMGLLAVFSYFQLYLQRLWERLAELPAIFEDGTPLDKKATPWLLVGYVRAHFKLLRNKDRPHLSRPQTLIIQLMAWWLPPATLVAIWLHYLFLDPVWWVCALQVAATLAGLYGALAFLHRARLTLRLGTFSDPEEKHSLWERAGVFCMQRLGRILFVGAVGAAMIWYTIHIISNQAPPPPPALPPAIMS